MIAFPVRLLNDLLTRTFGIRLARAYAVRTLWPGWLQRVLYLSRLLDQVKDVEGDVCECGVKTGWSFAILASLVRGSAQQRHLWGFDTWKGLPPPRPEDYLSDSPMAYETEVSPLFAAAVQDVRNELRFHGFSEDEIRSSVTLVQGLFADTLRHAPDGRVALVHIDADLYQSYKDALNLLWSRVSVGGLVAFDEYEATEDWPGARLAVDEFLATLPERSYDLQMDQRSGKYFVVKLSE